MQNRDSIWLSEHNEELQPYTGKWVAVWNEQIIASGNSIEEVMTQAKSQTEERPLVIKVPPQDEGLHIL